MSDNKSQSIPNNGEDGKGIKSYTPPPPPVQPPATSTQPATAPKPSTEKPASPKGG